MRLSRVYYSVNASSLIYKGLVQQRALEVKPVEGSRSKTIETWILNKGEGDLLSDLSVNCFVDSCVF